ncbi:MAG: rRNA pseudouridine synthase [Eubacteriaceae bacterium]|nr:rRNA pseudouridine synthase [Eubacteriaceae bacterium]
MRLQKYLAESGIASRRKSEEYIRQGRIKVNGAVVNAMGCIIDETKDRVEFDGKPVCVERSKIYVLLNKPAGTISSAKDEKNRRTVTSLIGVEERIYPVGRLDYDTEGMLILTNDGEFSYEMTHPSHEMTKTYFAKVKGKVEKTDIDIFQKGMVIDGYKLAPAVMEIIKADNQLSEVRITIREGRNRQIRKMCDLIGHPVQYLSRIKIGNLNLGDLKTGKWRYLTEYEIRSLKELIKK